MKKKIVLVVIGFFILFLIYNDLKFDANIKYDYGTVNEKFEISIETKRFNNFVNADEVEVSIYNKYKTDESLEAVIEPYRTGNYKVIYIPEYSSTYNINIIVKEGNKVIRENKEIKI